MPPFNPFNKPPNENENKKPPKKTNNVIATLVAATTLGLTNVGCDNKQQTTPEKTITQSSTVVIKKTQRESAPETQKIINEIRILTKKVPVSKNVDTKSIEGYTISDLYTKLLGINGKVGPAYDINFGQLMGEMWISKLKRRDVSGATKKEAINIIKRYTESTRKPITLKEFIKQVEEEVNLVQRNLNYKEMCRDYKIGEYGCFVLEKLIRDLRGLDIVAYGMTELFPSADGNLNVKVLDILLRNAGLEYISIIPALYDGYLSFGFYQFTSLALNEIDKQGASRVNKFLQKQHRIPGSVKLLSPREQHRAATLFAIHNLALLVKNLKERDLKILRVVLKTKPGDIVTFIAAAHHAPSLAISAAKNWLRKGAKGNINQYLRGRLIKYGKKTDNNLSALEKFN